MARTLAAAAATEAAKVNGASLVHVLEIQWSDGTVYYSDQTLSTAAGDAVDAAGAVRSWGQLQLEAEPGQMGGHAALSVDLLDTDLSLKAKFDAEPGPAGTVVYVHLLFGDTTWASRVTLFGGSISGGVAFNASEGLYKLNLRGLEKTFDKSIGTILKRDDFPTLACSSHEGQMIPIVYGENVKRVPAKLISRPGQCYLAAAVDEHATTLTLTKTAAQLGLSAGVDVTVTVGTPELWEQITGQFATVDSSTLTIVSRKSILAEGTSPGVYSYQGTSYLLIPAADLPSSGDRNGHPLWYKPAGGSWSDAYVIDSWVATGSNIATVRQPIGVTFPASGASYKIGAVPGMIVQWASGTPVYASGDWVYAVSHLPCDAVDSVEVRVRDRSANSGSRSALYYQLDSANYSVELNDTAHNTALGRAVDASGITTLTLSSPPSAYGFEDELFVNCDGPNSGTEGAVIQLPGAVLSHLLGNSLLGDVPAENINSAAFSAVDSLATVEISTAITTEKKLHEIASEIATQCGCLYFWDQGKAQLRLVSTTLWPIDSTLNDASIAELSLQHVDTEKIFTAALARWVPTLQSEERKFYRASTTAVGHYTERRKEWDFWALNDPAHVADRLEFWLTYHLAKQRAISFSCYLDKGLTLQPGDVVSVTFGSVLDAQLARVTRVAHQFADASNNSMELIEVEAEFSLWTYAIDTLDNPDDEETLCDGDGGTLLTKPENGGGAGESSYGFGGSGKTIGYLRTSNGTVDFNATSESDSVSGNCGTCTFVAVGVNSCLGGSNNAPASLLIDSLGFLGTDISLAYDSDCLYIGDEIAHDCST